MALMISSTSWSVYFGLIAGPASAISEPRSANGNAASAERPCRRDQGAARGRVGCRVLGASAAFAICGAEAQPHPPLSARPVRSLARFEPGSRRRFEARSIAALSRDRSRHASGFACLAPGRCAHTHSASYADCERTGPVYSPKRSPSIMNDTRHRSRWQGITVRLLFALGVQVSACPTRQNMYFSAT
jgi:hypothetical protein